MVQIGLVNDDCSNNADDYPKARHYRHDLSKKYRSEQRMSDGEEDTPNSDSVSPKSEGFSNSPMSISGDDSSSSRPRTVLDLSVASAFIRKPSLSEETTPPYSHSLVPPYSPLSSSASTSSSAGSPSVTPEVNKDEISIHDIAKEVNHRRSRTSSTGESSSSSAAPANHTAAAAAAAAAEFDLPKNFYGYYVYQLELASRFSSSLRTLPTNCGTPIVGKVKPTLKSDPKDDDVVSYGSLLEQALRNGLKRSPSEVPAGLTEAKKSKRNTPVSTPPPTGNSAPQPTRSSTVSQISVEDVAKTSLREMLHTKQMMEAKAGQSSRSSSPTVNLKTLLEVQGRGRSGEGGMAFTPVGVQKHAAIQQQLQMQSGKCFPGQPLIYPHILQRPGSPGAGRGGMEMGPGMFPQMGSPAPAHGNVGGAFKMKKLLEWTAADVRDWVSTLNYCSEFADVFLQQSVDGVALTLLNETHLMKNFAMKLGPAIKLRCAVWEILGLCRTANAIPQMQMSQFLNQKQIPVGHCIPQHHSNTMSKQ